MSGAAAATRSLGTAAKAARVQTLPLVLVPVCVGAALAWQRTGRFAWGWFLLTVVGAVAAHAGAILVNDFFDDASGADRMARDDRASVGTGSMALIAGEITPLGVLGLAAGAYTVALACAVVLSVARGWAIMALAAAGFLLGVLYVAPPVRYGYRGAGELGIFAAYGPLAVAGAYGVQARALPSEAWWAGVVPGLLVTLALYHHNFLHWRADRESGKRTPVAILGPERAIGVSPVLIAGAYGGLVAQVAIGLLPAWALLALPTALPIVWGWARVREDHIVQHCLQLLGVTLGSTTIAGAILAGALVLDGALR